MSRKRQPKKKPATNLPGGRNVRSVAYLAGASVRTGKIAKVPVVRMLNTEQVVYIDPVAKQVRMTKGDVYEYDTLKWHFGPSSAAQELIRLEREHSKDC